MVGSTHESLAFLSPDSCVKPEILKAPPYDPDVSPLLFASLEGLPPAYMQVCGLDPMRDEALVYHERLQEAGVPCKLDMYVCLFSGIGRRADGHAPLVDTQGRFMGFTSGTTTQTSDNNSTRTSEMGYVGC